MIICDGCNLPKHICHALSCYNKALFYLSKQDMLNAVSYFEAALKAEEVYYAEHEVEVARAEACHEMIHGRLQ